MAVLSFFSIQNPMISSLKGHKNIILYQMAYEAIVNLKEPNGTEPDQEKSVN